MKQPARQALVLWFVALALAVAALFAFLGAPASADGAGEAIGRLFAHTGFAALASWAIARNKAPPWSWLKFTAVYIVAFVLLAIVTTAGRLGAT